jgi:hypothetical protein
LIPIKLPAQPPSHVWPNRTGLLDLALASTSDEIHQVSLGLEFHVTSGPWLFEGRGHEIEPEAVWGRWYPHVSPPGWWRVRSEEGLAVRQVRFHRLLPEADNLTPGALWLRALAHGHPLVFCPDGLEGPGIVVTPELGIPWADMEHVLGLVAVLNKADWPGLFTTINPRDAAGFKRVFGGTFSPGRTQLDPIMRLVLMAGPNVPGFPKLPGVDVGLDSDHTSRMRGSRP